MPHAPCFSQIISSAKYTNYFLIDGVWCASRPIFIFQGSFTRLNSPAQNFIRAYTVKQIRKFYGKIRHLPLLLRTSTCKKILEIKIWYGYVNRQHSKMSL